MGKGDLTIGRSFSHVNSQEYIFGLISTLNSCSFWTWTGKAGFEETSPDWELFAKYMDWLVQNVDWNVQKG